MNILFFMTSHTGGRGFSIFDSRQVTVLALNRLLHMSIIEGEIRFGMVKGGRVQWGNVGFAALVFRVALVTGLMREPFSMNAFFLKKVGGDGFMAILAERVLCGLIESFVAFRTLFFPFHMAFKNLSWHQQEFQIFSKS
jgi:hypothetical protein